MRWGFLVPFIITKDPNKVEDKPTP